MSTTPEADPIIALSGRSEPQHRVDCSWCRAVIRPGITPVTHSICPACAETYFPQAAEAIAKARQ